MDAKLFAWFYVLCLIVHCCPLCESRPRKPGRNCVGLIKSPLCPNSNISISKRILDEVLQRTQAGEDDETRRWEDEMTQMGDRQQDDELGNEAFDNRQDAEQWGLANGGEADLAARSRNEDLLREKELELLFVRALLDDLESEKFDDL
ncbi:uncharacterized protein [Diadema setosum]|uniref:uncharacterized protein n=1 Tax=Diadema setosum TaxID=31175 RepID=UPI003B3B50FD